MVSGPLVENCKQTIGLDLDDFSAEDESFRFRGRVDAAFSFCRGKGTENERPGVHYLSVSVEANAKGAVNVSGQCLLMQVEELTLNPLGFVGNVTDFLGLTDNITRLVLKEATAFFEENPICPKLPPEIAVLQPNLNSGGALEIGDGGLGAAVSGSVDVSPATMVTLIAQLKADGVFESLEQ